MLLLTLISRQNELWANVEAVVHCPKLPKLQPECNASINICIPSESLSCIPMFLFAAGGGWGGEGIKCLGMWAVPNKGVFR